MKKSVWLHNIRSVYNVGSIFRTADAVGIDHIYLSGYTPLPIDRFGRNRSDMNKIGLGAEQSISWSQLENPIKDIKNMKKQDSYLIGIEQNDKAMDIFNYEKVKNISEIIIVMGEEVLGMKKEQLELCDKVLEIPMKGQKESLNVSVAFGIAVYQIFN